MSSLDLNKPHIRIERGDKGVTHAIWLDLGDDKPAGVVIDRTPENAAIIDYFFEKLKDGVNV